MSDDTLSDQDLLEASRADDKAAWRQLMERHLPSLGAYLGARLRRPDLIDDLLAKTVCAAWRHRDTCTSSDDFARWFRKMGANIALRWHRSHPQEPLCADLSEEQLANTTVAAPVLRQLDQAIGQLETTQRMAVEQFFRGGLRGAALAAVLHVDEGTAQELVARGLAELDAQLGAVVP